MAELAEATQKDSEEITKGEKKRREEGNKGLNGNSRAGEIGPE